MIKLKNIVKEIQSIDSYQLSKKIVDIKKEVDKFFKKHESTLTKCAEASNWVAIYKLAFQSLPQFAQDEVVQEINNTILSLGWLTKNDIASYNTTDAKLDHDSNVNEVNAFVSKWVKKNRTKLIKLADDNNYKEFYQLAKDQFPGVQEYKLVQAVNTAAIEHDIHYELSTEV